MEILGFRSQALGFGEDLSRASELLMGCSSLTTNRRRRRTITVWFLLGTGGMGYGDYYWGLYWDYYRDPFPHSLLSIRQRELSAHRSFARAGKPFASITLGFGFRV